MSYKEEVRGRLDEKLGKKLDTCPVFVSDYFAVKGSAVTKSNNMGIILDMFHYLINAGKIHKPSISEITEADLATIRPADLDRYFAYLSNKRGNANSSIRTKINILSGFFGSLVENGYIGKNPIDGVSKRPYREKRRSIEVSVPSEEQLDLLIRNIKKTSDCDFTEMRNLAIVKLFIGSGIRFEELVGLDMGDLFLDGDPQYIMVLGKGYEDNDGKDLVYISETAAGYLREYLEYREEYLCKKKYDLDKFHSSDAPVFLSIQGKRISKSAIKQFMDRCSENSIHPHMLRHLCGTEMYRATNNLKAVQKQLRHANSAVTSRYYVNTSDEDVCKALKMTKI